MAKRYKKEKLLVMHLDPIEATLINKPHYVPKFRCGAYKTEKDRPRDKNWRKWVQ